MAQENKVFDVSSPGSSKPDTGSKPMVVGHKNMLDPTLKSPTEPEPLNSEPMASRTEKTLAPSEKTAIDVSETTDKSESEAVIASDKKIEPATEPTAPKPESEQPEQPEPAIEKKSEAATESPAETAEEKQKTEDDLEIVREEKLQEMIKSKEYFAPINEASFSSFQSFFKTFILVILLGLILLLILIDAEILDVGINLPFDFL